MMSVVYGLLEVLAFIGWSLFMIYIGMGLYEYLDRNLRSGRR